MRNLILVVCLAMTAQFSLADSVNVYSFRQPFLIEPILEQFTKETGIEAKVVFAKDGLIQRLKREGKLSPADVVLTSNFSKLLEVKEEGLTQAFNSDIINQRIPAQFRDSDKHWGGTHKTCAQYLFVKRACG
ncbi:hypothetical protein ACU6U9_23190 [Pseudomonas sp. HK3]